MTETSEKGSLSPAVTRAIRVLEALARSREPVGLSELARLLGLPKSSTSNICSALVDGGLARKVDGGYALAQKVVELGASYLASVDEVREFHAVCREWIPEFEDTVQLAVLGDGLTVSYLARRVGSLPVRLASDIGRSLPANCAATGKALLASLDENDLARHLPADGNLPTLTPKSISTVEQLLPELERVRARGYAVDDEETLEGLSCVAKAVPGRSKGRRWAVSFTLLKARLTEERLAYLASTLEELAARLAGRVASRGL